MRAPLFFVAWVAACGRTSLYDETPVDAGLDAGVPGRIGDACSGDPVDGTLVQGSCAAGEICEAETLGYPGGYCSEICAGVACPDGSVCVAKKGVSQCKLLCAGDADCRAAEGYTCVSDGGPSVCVPNPAPIGRRSDGAACYAVGTGPGALPALARTTFA